MDIGFFLVTAITVLIIVFAITAGVGYFYKMKTRGPFLYGPVDPQRDRYLQKSRRLMKAALFAGVFLALAVGILLLIIGSPQPQ